MEPVITPFDPAGASEREMAEHYAIALAARRADFPRLPEYTYDFHLTSMRNPLTAWGPRRHWVARLDGAVVGTAFLDFPERESPHTALPHIRVRADLRRRGIGTALLRTTLAACRAGGRDTVVGSGIPDGGVGAAWARSLGFAGTAVWVRQILDLRGTDPALWRVPAPDGFRTALWSGAAPQDVVAGYARARTAIQDAPKGDTSLTWPDWTVERVRRHEADAAARNSTLYAAVAVHEATGTVAGLTEVEIREGLLDVALQQDTAVLPAYRGRGLGRFIKAAMLRRLTAEHPGVTHVITNTATDNRYMIRVNEQIGYATDGTLTTLETGLDPLERRLAP